LGFTAYEKESPKNYPPPRRKYKFAGMNPHFNHLNNFFDKIYVLTIPAAVERQKEFAKVMNGLRFSFFNGVEQKKLDVKQLSQSGEYDEKRAKKNQRYEKSMTSGELACAIGHRNIYQDIVANNVKRALIFEDDAFPLRENIQLIPEMFSTLPEDWNIIFFDYNKNEKRVPLKRTVYHVQHFLGFLKWDHTVIKNLFPREVNKHWKTSGHHDFSDAYAITNEGARKLLEMQTPVSFVADNLLANAATKEHLKGYIAVPKLFAQRSAGEFKSIDTLIEKPIKAHSQASIRKQSHK
jgi:glycosyl transferase, family 25